MLLMTYTINSCDSWMIRRSTNRSVLSLLFVHCCREVRNAALASIQLSMSTLGEVMKRSRDADENIRVETYKMIEQKVPFKRLSTEQRIDLLRSGFADSVERVRTACLQMVKNSWLAACSGSMPTLLSALDVEDYEDTAEQVLRALLQDLSGTQPFGTKGTITPQEAVFWRVFAEQIKTCPAEVRAVAFTNRLSHAPAVAHRPRGSAPEHGDHEDAHK